MEEKYNAADEEKAISGSHFDGDALTSVSITLLSKILRACTLDIIAPLAVYLRLKFRIGRTTLSGRRMIFDGKWQELFWKNVLWVFLSVITVGLFLPFKSLKMTKWETRHTHFAGVPDSEIKENGSKFTGKWYQLLGVNLLTFFVTVITLSFGYYWAYCYKERWMSRHKIIDGHALSFNGRGRKFFGKRLLWSLLSLVTLGIYSLLIKGRMLRWTVARTAVERAQDIPFDEELAAKQSYVRPTNKYLQAGFISTLPAILFLLCAYLTLALSGYVHDSALWVVSPVFCVATAAVLTAAIVFSVKARAAAPRLDGNGKYLSVVLLAIDCALAAADLGVLIYSIYLSVTALN